MKLVEPKPLVLADVASAIMRINNPSRTLKWGSHIEDDMLVLVTGHPSVKNSRILYLIVRPSDEGISLRCEVSGVKDFEREITITDRKELSSIVINILKEVYGG